MYVRDEQKKELVDAVCRDVDVSTSITVKQQTEITSTRTQPQRVEGSGMDQAMNDVWDTEVGTCELIEWGGGGDEGNHVQGQSHTADSTSTRRKNTEESNPIEGWRRNEVGEEWHDPNIVW